MTIENIIKSTGTNTFKIITNENDDMHWVILNRKTIYRGNGCDFHPGCHGGWCATIGDFSSPRSFVNAIIVKYKITKFKVVSTSTDKT